MDELERVLILRYALEGGPPQTLEEVATELGTTRERVRKLEERAFCEPRLVVLRQGGVPQVTYVLIDPATDAAYYLGFERLLVRARVSEARSSGRRAPVSSNTTGTTSGLQPATPRSSWRFSQLGSRKTGVGGSLRSMRHAGLPWS